MSARPSFLEVKEVRKHYGAIKAVDGVSLSVGPGEIVGVIGPNGSGKTTLFNSILGQIKPSAGMVEFCGEDITGMSPLQLSRLGVGRTFQTLQVFGKLSVRDNLIVAAQEFQGTLASRLRAKPDFLPLPGMQAQVKRHQEYERRLEQIVVEGAQELGDQDAPKGRIRPQPGRVGGMTCFRGGSLLIRSLGHRR